MLSGPCLYESRPFCPLFCTAGCGARASAVKRCLEESMQLPPVLFCPQPGSS